MIPIQYISGTSWASASIQVVDQVIPIDVLFLLGGCLMEVIQQPLLVDDKKSIYQIGPATIFLKGQFFLNNNICPDVVGYIVIYACIYVSFSFSFPLIFGTSSSPLSTQSVDLAPHRYRHACHHQQCTCAQDFHTMSFQAWDLGANDLEVHPTSDGPKLD